MSSSRVPRTVWLTTALGTLLAFLYFGRFAPAATILRQVAGPASAAVLVLLASLAAGEAGLRAARIAFTRGAGLPAEGDPSGIDETLLVGVPVFGTVVAAVAWSGLPLEASVILLTLVGAGVGSLLLWRRRPFGAAPVGGLRVALLLPPVFFAWLGAITPVTSPDELIYKLALPRQYLLSGGMVEMPLSSHSYFPAALSLSSLAALSLSGGVAAKLIHFGVFLAALAAIRRLAKRIAPDAADWAVAVVAWTPAILLVAGWAWPDWAVLGLLVLSYESWCRFRESGRSADAAVVVLALAGAASSKYTALPWLCVFVAVAALELRRSQLHRARLAAVTAGLLVLFGGFFYVRNVVWTGSPVAPLLLPDSPPIGYLRTQEPLGGWAALLHGDDIFDPNIIDDALGVLLPLSALLAPFGLTGAGRRFRDLFVIGALQLVGMVTFVPLSRYYVTAIVPLALLGVAAGARAVRAAPTGLRWALTMGAALTLIGQLLLVAYIQVVSYDFLPYVVGSESAERYLLRMQSYSRTYAWISAHTPPESRFMLLGETRAYYLDRPAVCAGNLDGPRMARYLARFPDPGTLGRELKRLGVTHVLVNRARYRRAGVKTAAPRLEQEIVLEVPEATDRMIAAFLATQARPVFADGDYAVFELKA